MKQQEGKTDSVQVEQDDSKVGDFYHVKSKDILEKVKELLNKE